MWVVLNQWQTDDYKGIRSGVAAVWVLDTRVDAEAKAATETRRIVEERFAEDDRPYKQWCRANRTDLPDDITDLDDDEIDALHASLFQGEYIPGFTEWFEVKRAAE